MHNQPLFTPTQAFPPEEVPHVVPEHILNDHSVRIYTVRSIDNRIAFQARRLPDPRDVKQVKVGDIVKVEGQYFGEFVDITPEVPESKSVITSESKKSKKQKAQKEVVNKEEELAKAVELLKALMNK